jgi:hypothetical protein
MGKGSSQDAQMTLTAAALSRMASQLERKISGDSPLKEGLGKN